MACGIFRGGKQISLEEQQKILKKDGKLGLMPQEEVCSVIAYCWTIESVDNVRKSCKEKKPAMKQKDDDSMGTYACTQIMEVCKYDVQNFRFFDEDTKCILLVRGGGSQVDNEVIRKCAKIARDSITPERIVPGEVPPQVWPPADAGSGSGEKKKGG